MLLILIKFLNNFHLPPSYFYFLIEYVSKYTNSLTSSLIETGAVIGSSDGTLAELLNDFAASLQYVCFYLHIHNTKTQHIKTQHNTKCEA